MASRAIGEAQGLVDGRMVFSASILSSSLFEPPTMNTESCVASGGLVQYLPQYSALSDCTTPKYGILDRGILWYQSLNILPHCTVKVQSELWTELHLGDVSQRGRVPPHDYQRPERDFSGSPLGRFQASNNNVGMPFLVLWHQSILLLTHYGLGAELQNSTPWVAPVTHNSG